MHRQREQIQIKKLFKWFEDALNTRVNFRMHRMELMTYRQIVSETTDECDNRAHGKGSLYEYVDREF